MNNNRLLLVEDDPNLGTILSEFLEVKGYDVHLATDGVEGQDAFDQGEFDICVLDVMMPRKDGFSLARDIRKTDEHVPILFLTAKNLIEDKSEGFSLGGDDYLTKPFSMEELLLRIHALLRRSGSSGAVEQTEFTIGRFAFDFTTRMLRIDAEEKRMTSREADLLRMLCSHKNAVMRREIALKQIWGDDSYFNARSMDVFITKLRKYLKADPEVEIMNVHGMGYKLVAK